MCLCNDAWGNHKVLNPDGTENTSAGFIGNINPIRYRGYYYDKDLGLYWLKTRFYDPQTGRFISPDSVEYLDPETLGGINLYAYCNNNPVMNVDPNGTLVLSLALLGAGLIVGGIIGGLKAKKEGKTGRGIAKSVILGSAMGLAAAGTGLMLAGVGIGVAGALAPTSTAITVGGMSAAQIFAVGALAFDFTAFVIAPIYGIAMEGVELDVNPCQPPLPKQRPMHPAEKRSKRWK